MDPELETAAPVQDRIAGAAALVAHFGYFPNFHDAEVVSVTLDRAGSTLVLILHASRDVLDDRGDGVRDRHVLVTITMRQLHYMKLENFYGQNVIFALVFTETAERLIECNLDESVGLSALVTAAHVAITFRPANADGTPCCDGGAIPPRPRG